MASTYDSNVLGAPIEEVGMQNVKFPCTITIKSAASNRLIELSTDGGDIFFVPEVDPDATNPSQVVVTVSSPITDVRISGNVGDKWVIV